VDLGVTGHLQIRYSALDTGKVNGSAVGGTALIYRLQESI